MGRVRGSVQHHVAPSNAAADHRDAASTPQTATQRTTPKPSTKRSTVSARYTVSASPAVLAVGRRWGNHKDAALPSEPNTTSESVIIMPTRRPSRSPMYPIAIMPQNAPAKTMPLSAVLAQSFSGKSA